MPLPADYTERVYAGVLGKIIGVYLGRPFEGWTHERIMDELGEVYYYVHERFDTPLVVTDDDISGTFTFVRALADHGYPRDLTPAQIGETWLNYIIENRTILWWGGMGNSTEHTAYLRLKSGIAAPHSGSIARNGRVVAEQIGAQIFIDGWAMVAPGDPAFAADLARRAASVSHDGEAIYGAQVIAAMEAQAFVEPDLQRLLDTATGLVPPDALIRRMIDDIRAWHAREPDWKAARARLAERYGYDRYGGNCHIIPNHGVIILALLYGADDFQRSLMIANTAGWDTDCNAGNVGCLLGIKNGLAGIESGPDFRGTVADRLYLPTADGGRAITDAVTEAIRLANAGRALSGQPSTTPKGGAQYHFELPGAVQGFRPEDTIETRGTVTLENVTGHSEDGTRALALHYTGLAKGRVARVSTPVFIPSRALARTFDQHSYSLIASPRLYPGQTLSARVVADARNARAVRCRLYVRRYGADDRLDDIPGPGVLLPPGDAHTLVWALEDPALTPIASAGVELAGDGGAQGTVYLDYVAWTGTPNVRFERPAHPGMMWRRAWVNGLDHAGAFYEADTHPEPYRLLQNHGRGLLIQGTREWTDYRVSVRMTPHMCKAGGLGVRVQGMRRYYALLLDREKTRLVRALGGDTVLAETGTGWQFGTSYDLALQVSGDRLTGLVDGRPVIEAVDPEAALDGGAVALICEEGRIGCGAVAVRPASADTGERK